MVQSISLDDIKTAIADIRKCNKRPDSNATHQYVKKNLEIYLTEDDITYTINFLLDKNILLNKSTSKRDSFYFTEKD